MASLSGFIVFIRGTMGITTQQLPDSSPDIAMCYALSQQIVNPDLALSPQFFDLATYNLGGDFLINYANDQPGQAFFAEIRKKWNINGFNPGVVQSSSDEGTSESMTVPDFVKNLSMSDLQNLKTPYGRAYMAIAMRSGSLWGIS